MKTPSSSSPSHPPSTDTSPPAYDSLITIQENHFGGGHSFVTSLEPHRSADENDQGHDLDLALVPTGEKDGLATSALAKIKDVEAETGRDLAADGDDGTRETWNKKVDFLLSIIGFAVDLANVWRFPYLCYTNGGGAFLIPYFTMLICGAVPLFLMELIMGQYQRQGAIAVWKIAPLFKGIGICQCLIAFYVAFYYNVIIAWSLYYLVSSFAYVLPWTTCNNTWNTVHCTEGSAMTNSTDNESTTAAAEFFERGVLGLHESSGIGDVGLPRTSLVLCLFGVFIMIYFSLWKGVHSSGKVVWVTATMPYVVLSILLVRGLMLPGASIGIMYYITPKLERLGDPKVWIDAAIQIFYSVGAGFGVHIAFASYNKINSNVYRDCLATVCVNSFTSLFSGFVIFSYLGYMSIRQNKDISVVAAEGPGLVFVVYPEAIATLPGSVGWSILFFVMLITLGIDSAMGGLEALLTGLSDEWKSVIKRYRFGREALTGLVVFGAFLFALPNVTNGGMYLVTMWDRFAAGTAILFGVFSQAVAVSWFYGLEQFCKDAEQILGFRPNLYWRLTWKFISPVFILGIVISSIVSFEPLEYKTYTLGNYTFPVWANVVGWAIALSSMSFIPIVAIYQLCSLRGPWLQRLALSISPRWEHRAIIEGGRIKRFQRRHWLAL